MSSSLPEGSSSSSRQSVSPSVEPSTGASRTSHSDRAGGRRATRACLQVSRALYSSLRHADSASAVPTKEAEMRRVRPFAPCAGCELLMATGVTKDQARCHASAAPNATGPAPLSKIYKVASFASVLSASETRLYSRIRPTRSSWRFRASKLTERRRAYPASSADRRTQTCEDSSTRRDPRNFAGIKRD